MSTKNVEIKVGVAVIAGLIILVCGLIWGRGGSSLGSRKMVTVRFENVQGLSKGDPVIVRGVKQGGVEAIELYRDYVNVLIWIRDDLTLYADVEVRIEDRELMGGRQIALDPGQSEELVAADRILNGSGNTGMMEMLKNAEVVLGRVDSLFTRLNGFLDQSKFDELQAQLQRIAAETEMVVKENRQVISRTAKRLDDMTLTIQEDSLSTRVRMVLDSMDKLAANLDSTAILTRRVIIQIDSKKGTAGNLIHDKELYLNLLRSSANMDSLIADIRKNPGKYFKVSLF